MTLFKTSSTIKQACESVDVRVHFRRRRFVVPLYENCGTQRPKRRIRLSRHTQAPSAPHNAYVILKPWSISKPWCAPHERPKGDYQRTRTAERIQTGYNTTKREWAVLNVLVSSSVPAASVRLPIWFANSSRGGNGIARTDQWSFAPKK